jgi:hypothetical protein
MQSVFLSAGWLQVDRLQDCDWRRTTLTGDPPLAHSKVVATVNLAYRGKKRFLDLEFDCVVNRRASGLVRFSYKLSIFQIVGFVICGLEAAGV